MQQVPPRITALLNQKGGVGKTTSTVNIGAAIAALGRRTLLIDLDPQSHLSLHLGVDGSAAGPSAFDALVDPSVALRDCIVQVRDNLWLLPSTTDLAGAEAELASHPDRNRILRERFEALRGEYDFVLIDCPPSLGVLTLNGLCLADEVVVPMQAQFLAMQGLTKLLETVQLLSEGLNPTLKVGGVILCMHETQTAHAREVVQELSTFFDEHAGSGLPWDGAKVLMPAIRRNIKLAEAPSFGQTIYDYAPWCPGAIDYRALAERFVRDWEVAHGVADAIAGKPTPEAAAAAAAAAARAAAAAAAAAAAFASKRFTPETAAAARAARLAKSPQPSVDPAPIIAAKVATPPTAITEPKPAARAKAAKPAAQQVSAETPPAPAVKSKSTPKPAPKSAPKPAVKPAPAVAPAAAPIETPVARSEPKAKAKPAVKSEPAAASRVIAEAATPARVAPAAEPAEAESIDPKHPFRAAGLPRRS